METNKPFKYIGAIICTLLWNAFTYFLFLVTCTVMQKNGAGLHVGHSCYWDSGNDNCYVTRWPNDKRKDPNARVVCVISVYGLAY